MLRYIRKDFAKVRMAMKMLTNDKMPDWACVVLYILLLPIGVLLWIPAMLYMWYITAQLRKLDK